MSRSNSIAILYSITQQFIDFLILCYGLYAACLIRQIDIDTKEFYLMAASITSFYFSARLFDLYQLSSINLFLNNTKNLLLTWIGMCFVITLLLLATKESQNFSRLILFTWMTTTPVMLILSRKILASLRTKNRTNKTNIAIVGNTLTSDYFLKHIEALKWPWISVYGIYDFETNTSQTNKNIISINELLKAAKENHINDVYITLPLINENKVEQLLTDLADTTVSVFIIPDLFLSNLMKSNWSDFAGFSIVSVYRTPFNGINALIKRLLDIVLSAVILAIIWPLMLLIAVAIKLNSKGPVLFKQHRYGLDGRVIKVWKFRTMNVCENGAQITQAQKNDVRITPLGKYLRKTSLDELPQFINVLQGSLSVVGPRPHANAHNEEYRKLIKGYMLRHKIKPGITGLAQVNGWRGETDTLLKMEKRVEYDLEYIQNWSIGLDLKIVFLTIAHGFYDKNAY